jgi:long-chain acyl-CoA synthetase
MKKDVKYHPVPRINSLQDMIVLSSRTYGEKLALEDLTNTPIPKLTYSGLMKQILRLGTALKGIGLPDRAHIALIGENRVQWGLSYLTAACFNYVIVPIDKNLSSNEILNIIHESDSVAIIFSESFEPMLREHQPSLKKLKTYISMDLPTKKDGFYSMTELIQRSNGCSVDELPRIEQNDMSVIIFTSGTLGRAKGVMLSQWNIASNQMNMLSMFFMMPEDRFLSVLPIHHTYECNCGLLCPLYAGSSIHYAQSLKTVVDDLHRVHATILLGVPLLFDKMFKRIYKGIREKKITSKLIGTLIRATDVAERFGWKSSKKIIFREIHEKFGGKIRAFITGGAAQDPSVAKGLREFGFTFIQGYGLTETSPILALNQPENFKDDAAGIPLQDVQIKINNPDSEGIGEIFTKGPNVMLGYYKNQTVTNEVFENGWFKTGDLGFMDDEGFLHISGRKKNVIISKSGKNVFPEEIEDALKKSTYIMESLVYGEKDPKHDEIIAAQIVVDAEAFIEMSESKGIQITPTLIHAVISEEIQKVNKELTSYKQIKKFYVRDQEFQKTTTQKIKRYLTNTTVPND